VFDLAGAAVGCQDEAMVAELRRAYERLVGVPVSEEKWLLYQLVHIWDQKREHSGRELEVERASAQAIQRYLRATVFAGVALSHGGEFCGLDVDGVLETEHLGFPSMSPRAAVSLRALALHGFRPIIVTGRSLDEVRERCTSYPLVGGVAEYGSVAYNHTTGRIRTLLSESDQAALERLRKWLHGREGVSLDPSYRHSVRAFRLDSSGRRRHLDTKTVARALAESGTLKQVRPIEGEAQTDFVALHIDKGIGVRALLKDLASESLVERERPLALAVGDTEADRPLLALAERAFAPSQSTSNLRGARVTVVGRPYQAGLEEVVRQVIGHRPGECVVCALPDLAPETRTLLDLLAAQEKGTLSIIEAVVRLAIRPAWSERAGAQMRGKERR